jgi:hypothetical protein
MRESDLYPAVKRWLDERGYTVHVEIFGCDIVAVKDGRLLVLELKLKQPGIAENQARHRARWADEVVIAMPHRPKLVSGLKYQGIGLLVVSRDKARLVIKPRQQPWFREKQRLYRFKVLSNRAPAQAHEVAGLPCCPELARQRRARTVKEESC